ncbi:MAG: hypothetical protein WBL27_00635 [Salinimicrobium sp.]
MKKLLLVLFLSVSGNLLAQSGPENLIEDFFTTYKKDAGQALRDIYATNAWTNRIKDDIDKMVGAVNGFTESSMGEYYGYELITTKKFSESFVLYSYLVKYDRQPIRFIFKFYKPDDKWKLYSFSFDDNVDDEIQEAAKLYYLNLNQ